MTRKDDKGDQQSGGETTWTNTGATRSGRGLHTTRYLGDRMLRPSPNHGTLLSPYLALCGIWNYMWTDMMIDNRPMRYVKGTSGIIVSHSNQTRNIIGSDSCTFECCNQIHIYTTIGELSSKVDEFLAARSPFDSDHGVDFFAPTCCQSATFVRPLFAFYCPLFFTRKKS